MASFSQLAREEGVAQLFSRSLKAAFRRFRDRFTARRLEAPGFRCGRSPRLMGLKNARIGHDFNAGDDLWLECVLHFAGEDFAPSLILGAGVHASDRVHIACLREITIGDGTLIGSGCLVSDHAHGSYGGEDPGSEPSDPAQPPSLRPLRSAAPVHIGRNVWLGDGVAVLAGASIGDGCVIGANSVVTGAIAAGTVAVGVPARPVRSWNPGTRRWEALRPGAPVET